MKKTVLLLGLISSSAMFSQVGINTPTPTSTLDITAKNPTGTTTNTDGLLIPRVDRQRAQSMTGTPTSTLIYVNSIATGTQTGTAANVDAVGHYYFNGSVWAKFNANDFDWLKSGNAFPTSPSDNSADIYHTAGHVAIGTTNTGLAGFRIVANNNDVDNEFHIDSYDSGGGPYNAIRMHKARGTEAAPANLQNGDNIGALEFIPYFNNTAASYANGTGLQAVYEGNGTNNLSSLRFFTSGSMPLSGERMRIDPNGRVGIGITAPGEKLDVGGAITYTGQAIANKTGAASIDYAASTVPAQARILSWGPDAATSGIISFWTGLGGAVASEKMRVHSNGNVGIGTLTPQRLLHVNGALQVTNELNVGGNATTAGSAGTAGQILISGGAGAAPSWQNASAASVNIYNADGTLTGNRTVTQGANTLTFNSTTTNGFSVDGNTFSVDAANNRIGIGTTAPSGRVDIISDNIGSADANDFYFTGYGTSKAPGLYLGSANGTLAAPTNLANGDPIGGVYFNPRINGAFNFTTGAAMLSTYRGDGVTGLSDLQFRTSNNDRMKIDEIGNVGIGTITPARLLHVAGNARITGSIGTPTALMGRDATGDIGSITLGSGLSLTGGTLSSTATGTNIYNADGTLTGNRTVTQGTNTLTFNTTATNGFGVARTGVGYILSVDGVNSRVGIGTTTPAQALHVAGSVQIVDGTQGANKIFVSNANGVGSWQDPAQSKEILALNNSANQTALTGVSAGGTTTLTNFVQSVNTIPGATFNAGTDQVFLPQGTYEISVSYELTATGTCPAQGFLINSYFIDFPNNGGSIRIHCNAPSICGSNSVHSALWVTTVVIPAGGQTMTTAIGRGVGGNYADVVTVITSSRMLFKKIL